MVEVSDVEMKEIMKKAIHYPYLKVNDGIIPVWGYTKESRALIPDGYHAKYDRLVAKHGAQSPNCVRAIMIGTDAVVKTMFSGEEVRGSFGFEGSRKIDEITSQVATKEREPVGNLLECVLYPKMNNLEEMYIDRQILIITGMNVKALEAMNDEDLIRAVKSARFAVGLFGEEVDMLTLFPRLATIVLGKRELTVNQFKGNWELIKKAASEESKEQLRIANRHWTVDEKTYLRDEKLYRYVREYNKKYFEQ